MYKYLILAMVLFSLSGCASTPGTRAWHKVRLQEIELSYQNKEITKAEYLALKNDVDNTSASYRSRIAGGILSKPAPAPSHIYVTPTR